MVTKEEWAELDRKVQGWIDWRGKKEMEKAARDAKAAAKKIEDDTRVSPEDMQKRVTI